MVASQQIYREHFFYVGITPCILPMKTQCSFLHDSEFILTV